MFQSEPNVSFQKHKDDKNEILKEAESVHSYDSEQETNFTMFPMARVVLTKILRLSPFFSKFLFWKKLFPQNLLNTNENTKF